jgi:hypothetical protein
MIRINFRLDFSRLDWIGEELVDRDIMHTINALIVAQMNSVRRLIFHHVQQYSC